MATYPDPDAFFDQSQIEYGNGGGQQSIRDSLKATNAAAYQNLWALQALTASLADYVNKVWTGITWEFENQAPDSHLTDTPAQSLKATNGQVYRNSAKLDALTTAVTALAGSVATLASDVAAIKAAVVPVPPKVPTK